MFLYGHINIIKEWLLRNDHQTVTWTNLSLREITGKLSLFGGQEFKKCFCEQPKIRCKTKRRASWLADKKKLSSSSKAHRQKREIDRTGIKEDENEDEDEGFGARFARQKLEVTSPRNKLDKNDDDFDLVDRVSEKNQQVSDKLLLGSDLSFVTACSEKTPALEPSNTESTSRE
ncbi:hypothetical protein M0802_010322 [Mischocyttarus mexicanus]|nr:hypothetical protein M0802_010322 [Mischocyttarus mexicanus]